MKSAKKILYALALVGLLIVLIPVAFYAWFYFGGGICAEETLLVTTSPDGRIEAVVLERDCGAMARSATRVAVKSANWEETVFSRSGSIQLSLSWTSPETLLVTGSSVKTFTGSGVFRKVCKIPGLEIEYQGIGNEHFGMSE